MTEEVKDATQADAAEPQGAPTPAMPSADLPAEGSAPKGPDVSAIVEEATKRIREELNAQLDERVDARFKSAKDRRFAKVEEIYEWVKAAGGNVEAIKSDLEISDLRDQIAKMQGAPSGDAGPSPALDSGWSVAQAKTDIILKGAGIAPDDAEYNLLVEQYRGKVSSEAWPDVVDTFAKSRRGGSPAAVVSETGGNAPVSADLDTLTERLDKLTRSGGSVDEIRAIHEEIQKAIQS